MSHPAAQMQSPHIYDKIIVSGVTVLEMATQLY